MRIRFALAGLVAALVAAGAAQAQDFKPRIVRFGYGLVDNSNQGRAARMFAQEVEKASGGKMKVRAIGNASLGSDTQMQQALIGGGQRCTSTWPPRRARGRPSSSRTTMSTARHAGCAVCATVCSQRNR